MADLDDFFKKRDKKKKPAAKSKFSVLDTEEFAKQLEATTIRGVDVDGELDAPETGPVAVPEQEVAERRDPLASRDTNARDEVQDEEWKPFDSDENKDYTGLRINIQNWKVEDEENNYEEANDENDKKAACPWGAMRSNKHEQESKEDNEDEDESQTADKPESTTTTHETTSTSKPETFAAPAPASAQPAAPATGAYMTPAMKRQLAASGGGAAPVTEAPAPSVGSVSASAAGKYIPPSMRGKMDTASGLAGSIVPSLVPRKPGKAQPNIMDTMEFPTLDNAVTGDSATAQNEKLTNGGNDKFELAKKGGRVDTKTGKSNQIDLENKFGALDASNQ